MTLGSLSLTELRRDLLRITQQQTQTLIADLPGATKDEVASDEHQGAQEDSEGKSSNRRMTVDGGGTLVLIEEGDDRQSGKHP